MQSTSCWTKFACACMTSLPAQILPHENLPDRNQSIYARVNWRSQPDGVGSSASSSWQRRCSPFNTPIENHTGNCMHFILIVKLQTMSIFVYTAEMRKTLECWHWDWKLTFLKNGTSCIYLLELAKPSRLLVPSTTSVRSLTVELRSAEEIAISHAWVTCLRTA